ncbi:hypothetical protein MWMV18_MWMV18_03377 [Acinetobacter calcoaceticus]|nr:hypothetical protein MWMV18_MWMV18_03377 [Acinetobacter calcoaceticus]
MLDLDEMNGNFFNFDHVDTFKLEHDPIMNCYNLVLILSKDLHDPSTPKFNVCFNHISDLSLNDSFRNNFQQFPTLLIEKHKNQWENVNYEIRQVEDDDLSFKCKSFTAFLS